MSTGVPILKGITATPIPDFVDFSADGQVGWVMMTNKGAESIWIAFDALPAGVTTGDGRMELKPTQRVVIGGISIIAIGCRTADGPADMDVVALT